MVITKENFNRSEYNIILRELHEKLDNFPVYIQGKERVESHLGKLVSVPEEYSDNLISASSIELLKATAFHMGAKAIVEYKLVNESDHSYVKGIPVKTADKVVDDRLRYTITLDAVIKESKSNLINNIITNGIIAGGSCYGLITAKNPMILLGWVCLGIIGSAKIKNTAINYFQKRKDLIQTTFKNTYLNVIPEIIRD